MKWSLGPTRVLLESLGHPEEQFLSIHIGGTNGKGSVSTMVYEALRSSGLRTALYTSPHLVDVRERMVVDDRPITCAAFATWTERLKGLIVRHDASFFEATTAIAFADFAARGADVAVVEVGLGGRLDATNVLTPLACAVTNVSLEHTEYLGTSLKDIAWEKAGIAKVGIPMIVGESDDTVASYVAERAEKLGAKVVTIPPDLVYEGEVGLKGRFQSRNASVAEEVLNSLPKGVRPSADAIARGIASARLPGRFDQRGKWIFDVAHNPAGVATLVELMCSTNPRRPIHALVGILDDKDWRKMVANLRPNVEKMWITTPPSAPDNRRLDLRELESINDFDVTVEPDFDRALAEIQVDASTILVVGSFHTVGDVMSRLPGFPPLG